MRNTRRYAINSMVVFVMIAITQIKAQGDFLYFGRNWNYERNDCLWYNIYTVSKYYADSMVIDTANLCRVKRNKIRSVSVYRFSNWEDTSLMRHINYDTNGFFMNSISNNERYTRNCDFCDSINHDINLPGRKVERYDKTKRVWIRNDSGFISEYKYFNRGGIWNRFISALISQHDYKSVYIYSNEGRTVTENRIPKRYFSVFRRWTREVEFRTVLVFDENENLLSEHNYNCRGEEEVLDSSYFYKYEYY